MRKIAKAALGALALVSFGALAAPAANAQASFGFSFGTGTVYGGYYGSYYDGYYGNPCYRPYPYRPYYCYRAPVYGYSFGYAYPRPYYGYYRGGYGYSYPRWDRGRDRDRGRRGRR